MARPVKKAAKRVDNTASIFAQIGAKVLKYGVRMTFVKMLPKPVIDFTIKDRK